MEKVAVAPAWLGQQAPGGSAKSAAKRHAASAASAKVVRAGRSDAASATCTKKTALSGFAAPPEAARIAPMATRSTATPSATSRDETRGAWSRRCISGVEAEDDRDHRQGDRIPHLEVEEPLAQRQRGGEEDEHRPAQADEPAQEDAAGVVALLGVEGVGLGLEGWEGHAPRGA